MRNYKVWKRVAWWAMVTAGVAFMVHRHGPGFWNAVGGVGLGMAAYFILIGWRDAMVSIRAAIIRNEESFRRDRRDRREERERAARSLAQPSEALREHLERRAERHEDDGEPVVTIKVSRREPGDPGDEGCDVFVCTRTNPPVIYSMPEGWDAAHSGSTSDWGVEADQNTSAIITGESSMAVFRFVTHPDLVNILRALRDAESVKDVPEHILGIMEQMPTKTARDLCDMCSLDPDELPFLAPGPGTGGPRQRIIDVG